MKIYVSHSSHYNYNDELYTPIKQSELINNNEIFFPHDGKVFNTKEIINTFNLIIAEVSYPTTGQGIELGWADYNNIPILCIYKNGAKISSSIPLITNNIIEYSDSADMITKIEAFINNEFNYTKKD